MNFSRRCRKKSNIGKGGKKVVDKFDKPLYSKDLEG